MKKLFAFMVLGLSLSPIQAMEEGPEMGLAKINPLPLYDELGVSPTACQAEIKKQYDALKAQNSPIQYNDCPITEQKKIEKLNKRLDYVYSILGQEKLRNLYDTSNIQGVNNFMMHVKHSAILQKMQIAKAKKRVQDGYKKATQVFENEDLSPTQVYQIIMRVCNSSHEQMQKKYHPSIKNEFLLTITKLCYKAAKYLGQRSLYDEAIQCINSAVSYYNPNDIQFKKLLEIKRDLLQQKGHHKTISTSQKRSAPLADKKWQKPPKRAKRVIYSHQKKLD